MSASDRVSNSEAGRVIGIAAIIAVSLGLLVTSIDFSNGIIGQAANQNATESQRSELWAPAPFGHDKSNEYAASCERPKDHEEADLCQQWRAAKAAEQTLARTDPRSLFNAFQFGLSIVTALATAWAAIAASRATKAAEQSVEISRAAIAMSERPWLTADANISSSLRFINGQGLITIDFTVENLGKNPAVEVLVYAKIIPWYFDAFDSLHEEFAETLQIRRNGPAKLGRVVFPKQPTLFVHHLNIWPKQISQITRDGRSPLIAPDILGCVAYVDPATNTQHETGFVFHLRGSAHGGNSIDTRTDLEADKMELNRAIVGGYVT